MRPANAGRSRVNPGSPNSRMAYVSISHGQWDAQIFTNDSEKLPKALGHNVSHQSAYKPEQAVAPLQQENAKTPETNHEQDFNIGLGL